MFYHKIGSGYLGLLDNSYIEVVDVVINEFYSGGRLIAFRAKRGWGRCFGHCYRFNRLVLSSLRPRTTCYDTPRGRVSVPVLLRRRNLPGGFVAQLKWLVGITRQTSRLRELLLTRSIPRLHATKYPWEHEKWLKTFDHQALVISIALQCSIISNMLGYAVDSKCTAKSAHLAIPSNGFHGGHSLVPCTPSMK